MRRVVSKGLKTTSCTQKWQGVIGIGRSGWPEGSTVVVPDGGRTESLTSQRQRLAGRGLGGV